MAPDATFDGRNPGRLDQDPAVFRGGRDLARPTSVPRDGVQGHPIEAAGGLIRIETAAIAAERLIAREARLRLEGRVHVHDRAGRVGDDDRFGRLLDGLGESGAFAFGRLAGADVAHRPQHAALGELAGVQLQLQHRAVGPDDAPLEDDRLAGLQLRPEERQLRQLGGIDVVGPEGAAQLVDRTPEDFRHRGVGVDDSRFGIEQQHAVGRLLDQAAIPLLAGPQRLLGLMSPWC
jgi:hypothetical protein